LPSLLDLQEAFASVLEDASRMPGAVAMFQGAPGRNLARLAVYRGNLNANCAKALASAYPVIRKIVGEEFFEAIAREYARAHPSQSGDLNCYGGGLARFLEGFAHTGDLPYLPDVARMEWLVHRAYFAGNPPAFDLPSLARMKPQRHRMLHPRLAPACALMASRWPLGRIWTIHQDDYRGAFEVDLYAGADCILIYRPRWRAQVISLAAGDYRFLDSSREGRTLGEALEAAAGDPAFDPSTALAHWIHAQVIAGLE
jgi:hypothetical protein